MIGYVLGLGFGLAGCGAQIEPPVQQGPRDVEIVAAMEAHYQQATRAHDALVQGELDIFRSSMSAIRHHELPKGSPAAWNPLHDQLTTAATAASEVTDLSGAAAAMASVTLACGTCHKGIGRGPVYPVPPVAEGDRVLTAEMREHQWSVVMLWDGVTGPSDYAWERGTAALAETDIFAESSGTGTVAKDMVAREQALRDLGSEGKTTTTPGDRAALFGRVLATCGGCHQAAGVKLPALQDAPPAL